MFDVIYNPFKEGDIINLSVSDIEPKIIKSIKPEIVEKLKEDNKNKQKIFRHQAVKLIEENKYLDIESGKLFIEYFCEFI